MPAAYHSASVNIAGVSITGSKNVEADNVNAYEITLPAAKALSSWVKTDADTAAGNLAGGHGYSTGTFDVYWTGGRRYGVAVTITVNACALDGGTGDDYPASADTTVVIAPHVNINIGLDGDNAALVAMKLGTSDPSLTDPGHISFFDADDDEIAEFDLTANATPFVYDEANGDANAFTGDVITYARATSKVAATLQIGVAQDSTP